MTPDRRIKRIQRWLATCKCNEFVLPTAVASHMYGTDDEAHDWEIIGRQMDKANELFAAELAWLCEYAADLALVADEVDAFANNIQLDIQAINYRSKS